MSRFLEIATPNVASRGVGISADTLGAYIAKAQAEKAQLYRSYFQFDETLVIHLEKEHTIKNFVGTHYLDRILFDVDKSGNSDQVTLDRVRFLVDELQTNWTDDVQVWFSGTGYHVVTPDFFGFEPSPFLPQDLKATLALHFPEVPETHSLCYTASLIRAEWTLNAKSGLHKIPVNINYMGPLTDGKLISPRDIHKAAGEEALLDCYSCIPKPTTRLHQDKIVRAKSASHQQVRTIPTDNVTCSMHIFNERPGPGGKRILKAMRLASVWRRKGMTPAQCITLLQEWCPNYSGSWTTSSPARVVSEVFGKPYEFGCHDEILSKYCDSICKFWPRKNMRTHTVQIQRMTDVEREFADHIQSGRSKELFNLHDVFPGIADCSIEREQIVVLTGDTGLGKSALTANILLPQKHKEILWVDRENSKKLLYRRLVQIEHGKTKEQVENHYKHSRNTFSHGLGHIAIPDFPITMEGILDYISNSRPDIVVIDTLEMIPTEAEFRGEGAELARVSYCIKHMKEAIARYGTLFWIIHHLKKGAAVNWKGELQKLTTDSIKGNSMVAQQGDTILSVERTVLDPTNPTRWFRSLKSRDSEPFETFLTLDGNTMRFG